MIPLLAYLLRIRIRKLFGKDDYLAVFMLLTGIGVVLYFLNRNYSQYASYSLVFLLEIVRIHTNRKDLELLKLSPNYHTILFLEYNLYAFPTWVLLLLNQKFIEAIILLAILTLISRIPKINRKTLHYPFKMFDPFWVVAFRKNRLLLYFPLVILLGYMGIRHNNENLHYAILVFIGMISCSPSFEREEIIHIKASHYIGKNYLFQQYKTTAFNFMYIGIPLAILFGFLQQWFLIALIPMLLLFPMLNLLFKYVFFERKMLHALFFTLFLGNIIYGLPLLLVPLLYFKAIKNLNAIQNA